MSDTSLALSFSTGAESSTLEDRFVHLEQITDNGFQETVTMQDIQQMLARARVGMPAGTYKPTNCPARIEGASVVVRFDFYVWPSRIDLPHTLTSSMGAPSGPTIIEKGVEFSSTFTLSDVVEFDFILNEITSYTWETDCYNSQGEVVDPGDLVLDGMTTIRIDRPVFGVVRIRGRKLGAQHSLETRLVKYVPEQSNGEFPTEEEFEESAASTFYTYNEWLTRYYGYTDAYTWNGDDLPEGSSNMTGLKITNVNATVTAHWIDIYGEEAVESLTMDVPQCVQDLLARCDGDEDGILDPWGGTPGGEDIDPCEDEEGQPREIVYVNSCTGEVLDVRPVDQDNTNWCNDD